ncbi:MAG TPA: hypothetical protein VKA67_12045, partial [Verrucomicrobiae bacterium]|nr:hypothetical protein [Verrucomicrobiae bacterium]
FYSVLSFLQLALGMAEKQPGRLRLGLLLIMATAMVKFEGIILLAMWCVVLLLDKDSRALFWPIHRLGWAPVVGVLGWMPYIIFRLHKPTPHPESAWLGQLFSHFGTVMSMAPMTWLAFLSRRFLRNDFVAWGSPDNQHAIWQGKWTGLQSLVDHATLGMGWVCLLLLIVAWYRGGKLRRTVVWLSLLFLAFATTISIVWCAVHSNPMNYAEALKGSVTNTGGRYLYPVMMAWFAGSLILLVRTSPDPPATRHSEKNKNAPSTRKKR